MLQTTCEKAEADRSEHPEPEQILPFAFLLGTQAHLENASREVKQHPEACGDGGTLLAEHAMVHRAGDEADTGVAGKRSAVLNCKVHQRPGEIKRAGRACRSVHYKPRVAVRQVRIADRGLRSGDGPTLPGGDLVVTPISVPAARVKYCNWDGRLMPT